MDINKLINPMPASDTEDMVVDSPGPTHEPIRAPMPAPNAALIPAPVSVSTLAPILNPAPAQISEPVRHTTYSEEPTDHDHYREHDRHGIGMNRKSSGIFLRIENLLGAVSDDQSDDDKDDENNENGTNNENVDHAENDHQLAESRQQAKNEEKEVKVEKVEKSWMDLALELELSGKLT